MAIRLVAFDFGSTTSKSLEATAELIKNAVTGRTEIRAIKTVARPEPVFTPFNGDEIDERRIAKLVDQWLAQSPPDSITAGGVIVTGLAAKKRNAKAIAEAVRRRIGDAVIAVADNPAKESWLAFMGSCSALSAAHPERTFLNFDIGGGTTNLALGARESVRAAGSLWIGARHFVFKPGTYELTETSSFGKKVLERLKIKRQPGDRLSSEEAARIARFYVGALERAAERKSLSSINFIEQLAFRYRLKPSQAPPVLTFSGGVGELVYRLASGERPAVTPYGDLGMDLASAIVASPILSRDLSRFVPANLGRATVSGLAFYGAEASGATIFLPDRDILPLRDLPLLGRISYKTTQVEMNRLVSSAQAFEGGACLRAEFASDSLDSLRQVAGRLAKALKHKSKSARNDLAKNDFANGAPLIIFISQNSGKTFGQYATEWGRIRANLIVIDEIEASLVDQKAYFASISRGDSQRNGSGNMLVSFYGGINEGA